MLTGPALPTRWSRHDASDASSVERTVPIERGTDIAAGAPATFSRVAGAHRFGADAIDTLIEQLPVGVLVTQQLGHVVYRNEAARQLGIDRLVPVRWALTQVLLTGDAMREDAFEVRQPNGRRGWFRLDVTPVRDADGAVTGAVLTLADVTAERELTPWRPIMESLTNL